MRLLVTGGSGFMGTNLVAAACRDGAAVANADISSPLDESQSRFWIPCDILEASRLATVFAEFRPTAVVHFAARTDTTTNDPIHAYPQNIVGTANVLQAIAVSPSVERVIVTSTQFVCRPGYEPRSDDDYNPHTIYGESKVLTEQLTRASRLDSTWTIVRPTTVWGPWCERYRGGFFRALKNGYYVHPGWRQCVRSYGYVGNVTQQILDLLAIHPDLVNRRTLYVGDEPADLISWVNLFSRTITGRDVRVVPRLIVRMMAFVGDLVQRSTGRAFAINSTRYKSMTEDYPVDMRPTFELLGKPKFSVEEGVERTVSWLMETGGTP